MNHTGCALILHITTAVSLSQLAYMVGVADDVTSHDDISVHYSTTASEGVCNLIIYWFTLLSESARFCPLFFGLGISFSPRAKSRASWEGSRPRNCRNTSAVGKTLPVSRNVLLNLLQTFLDSSLSRHCVLVFYRCRFTRKESSEFNIFGLTFIKTPIKLWEAKLRRSMGRKFKSEDGGGAVGVGAMANVSEWPSILYNLEKFRDRRFVGNI